MKVAVTGASGVVGGAMLRHLIEAGLRVRALVRSDPSNRAVEAAGAEPVRGDLGDPASLTDLVSGCRLVFHIAGVNELCARSPQAMWAANVEGTRAVVEACHQQGVDRLVHTSSAVTLGERRGEVGDEETIHRGWFLSEYERSKHRSEELVREAAGRIDAVVVNPSSVQGPGRATGTGRLLLAAAAGRPGVAVETEFSIVDIDDCARGHLLAAERGKRGERYVLSGATTGTGEMLRLIEAISGRRSRVAMVPVWAMKVLAAPIEAVAKMAGRRPPLCREMVRVVAFGHRYDGSKAVKNLGLAYTPLPETLQRTIDWSRAEGLLGR